MLLAIDMGNTQIEMGLMRGEKLIFSDRLSTDLRKTESEYAVLMHSIFEIHGVDVKEIHGAIISSVVPPLTAVLKKAVHKIAGVDAIVVGPGVKNGLKIKIDDPKSLGADIVVDSVGALASVGAPVIVIDMGTATTITYVDENEFYRGGAYIPGLQVATNALVSAASKLPKIEFEAPKHVVSTNTVDAIKSGAIYGQASLLDGMIERISEEMGTAPHIIATGGLAELVIPYMKHEVVFDKELMIKGLKIIYDKNR